MKRIIVAEDDPGMQDALRVIFKRGGYDVVIENDGERLLSDELGIPDLYILDKQLSGVDGLDICRFLKNKPSTSQVPVIMLSADPHIEALSRQAGADNYLGKPFRLRSLLEMVSSHL